MIQPSAAQTSPPRFWLWTSLHILAVAGVAAAMIFEFIGKIAGAGLFLLAMGLLMPVIRASSRMSPVLRRYNTRILTSGAVYMVTFWIAANLHDELAPGSVAMWLAALVPAVPAVGMIWAMERYLAEETDEYLRHRSIQAALIGLGLVLVVGTVWGFLETFGIAPHVWSWWVFPAWAIGLGLGQIWLKVRGA